MNVKMHFKQTCQIVVSALLGNVSGPLSACSDDPQESPATVRAARAMLINLIFPCEYQIVEEIQI